MEKEELKVITVMWYKESKTQKKRQNQVFVTIKRIYTKWRNQTSEEDEERCCLAPNKKGLAQMLFTLK